MQRKHLIEKRGSCLAVVAVLLSFTIFCGCAEKGADSDLDKRGNDGVNSLNQTTGDDTTVKAPEVEKPPVTPGEPSGGDATEGLSAEMERRILQDYVDRDKEEPWYDGSWAEMLYSQRALEYYGTYNGWVVMRVMVPHAGVILTVTIDGFEFDDVLPTLIWKDGQIHTLKDAYVAGLLTQDDMRSINVLLGMKK